MKQINVLALTKYSYEGPSSRYRFYNYGQCFAQNGIDMTVKPLFQGTYLHASNKIVKILTVLAAYFERFVLVLGLLLFPKKYDLVLLEYELFPYIPAWFEYLLYKRGVKYIADYDDAIFHKYDMHGSTWVRKLLGRKIAKVMGYAEHLIVCNAYLETYAKKYNSHTLRLPTVVLLERYIKKMEHYKAEEGKPFVIGWIGSKSTSIYILDILPSIKKFVQNHDDARFDLVGFDETLLSTKDSKECHLNIISWSEETEIENILAFDVGIMPLRDDPWSRGKCGFKLVQYMSCKKPIIASPVGINCDLAGVENGLLARSEAEWGEAFERLYLDTTLRESMSQKNFEKIEEGFSHSQNCTAYTNLIKVLSHRHGHRQDRR